MKRALFVGHAFHAKSRSTAFFINRLKELFELHTLAATPETFDTHDVPDEDFHLVVIFQLDHLAPFFVAAGYRVVAIPMFDGSSGLPDEHWALLRDVLFVNFSSHLHVRLAANGCRSLYLKYFPDPDRFEPVENYDTLHGLFWQRRPAELSVGAVDRMAGDLLATLHVHNAPDYGSPPPVPDTIGFGRCKVTVSGWGDDNSEYLDALARCNFYVAPRLAEGIGMGFLEAMARGMVVVTHDQPTHNEYIESGTNGILIDAQRIGTLPTQADLGQIGRAARQTVVDGFRFFDLQFDAVMDALAEHAAPREPASRALMDFAGRSITAYSTSQEDYRRFLSMHFGSLQFAMLSQATTARQMFGAVRLSGDEEIAPKGTFDSPEDEPGSRRSEMPRPAVQDPDVRASAVHLAFGEGNAKRYCVSGWSSPEGTHTWIEGPSGTIRVPVGPPFSEGRVKVAFEAFTVDPLAGGQEVTVALDGNVADRIVLNHTYDNAGTTEVFALLPPAQRHHLTIDLTASQTWPEPNGGRILSIALRSLSLTRA